MRLKYLTCCRRRPRSPPGVVFLYRIHRLYSRRRTSEFNARNLPSIRAIRAIRASLTQERKLLSESLSFHIYHFYGTRLVLWASSCILHTTTEY